MMLTTRLRYRSVSGGTVYGRWVTSRIVKCGTHLLKLAPEVYLEKDVDSVMWKEVFYKEYKKRKDLHRVDEAILLYKGLLRRTSNAKCRYTILVHLGDLHRYRETSKQSPCFQDSQAFYEEAISLDPHSGSAYHGLALLATYQEAFCLSVYYYLRAAVCRSPFPSVQQNVRIALENNELAFQAALKENPTLNKKQSVNVSVPLSSPLVTCPELCSPPLPHLQQQTNDAVQPVAGLLPGNRLLVSREGDAVGDAALSHAADWAGGSCRRLADHSRSLLGVRKLFSVVLSPSPVLTQSSVRGWILLFSLLLPVGGWFG